MRGWENRGGGTGYRSVKECRGTGVRGWENRGEGTGYRRVKERRCEEGTVYGWGGGSVDQRGG